MAKPRKIRYFNPEQSLDVCLKKIASTRWAELTSFADAVEKRADIEAVHDLRVATRRFVSVLKAFGRYFPKKKRKKGTRALRRLLRALGRIREEDVIILKIEESCRHLPEAQQKVFAFLLARRRSVRDRQVAELKKFLRAWHAHGEWKHLSRLTGLAA